MTSFSWLSSQSRSVGPSDPIALTLNEEGPGISLLPERINAPGREPGQNGNQGQPQGGRLRVHRFHYLEAQGQLSIELQVYV